VSSGALESVAIRTGDDPVIRGRVRRDGQSGWQLTLCGDSESRILSDHSAGALEDAIAGLPDAGETGWFVEGVGRFAGESSDAAAILEAPRSVALEGPGCGTALGPGELRVAGNEPGWNLVIRSGGGRLATIDGTWDLALANDDEYEAGWPLTRDVILIGVASSGGGPAEDVRVRLSDGPCTDTMAGATFPFRATLIWNGEEHAGCAVDGREPLAHPHGGQE